MVLAWDAGGKVSKVAELACDQNPKALCSGDLNGDGVGDLAIGYGDGVELYLGRAEGFLPLKNVDIAGGCMYLRPADANADGTEDVVVLTGDGKIVAILMEP